MRYDRRTCYGIAEGQQPMSGRYPAIVYTEEGMREGMQEVDGDWPWKEAFFLNPSAITSQDGE